MKNSKYLVFHFLLLAVFTGCTRRVDVVATFGNQKITADELKERLYDIPDTYREYLSSPQGQRQFLGLIVREKIIMKEAKRSGVSKNKEYRDTLKRYNAEMKKRARDFKENLMIKIYLKQLYDEKLSPSEDEIKAYYQRNKSNFDRPVEIGVSHILLLDEKTASDVLSKLKSGEVFEDLARKYSADPTSAHRGGMMGMVKKGELDPAIEDAVRSLKVGGLSGVIKTEFGYHIVKKNSEKLLPPVKFEDAKVEIRRILVKSKFDEWIKKIVDREKVEINVDVVKNVINSVWRDDYKQ